MTDSASVQGHMPFPGHRTCAEWKWDNPFAPAPRKINLANAPSSMEQQAAEWARKAAA